MTRKLLFEGSAPVDAPIDQVSALIDGGWVLRSVLGNVGGDHLDIDHLDIDHLDIDHAKGTVGFQGHWWYRGEISASTDATGTTRLTYRVYNIARRAAWAVPLANRFFVGYDRQVQRATTDLAAAIERHLAGARPWSSGARPTVS